MVDRKPIILKFVRKMRKKADENAGKFEQNREMTRNEDQTSRKRQRCILGKENPRSDWGWKRYQF